MSKHPVRIYKEQMEKDGGFEETEEQARGDAEGVVDAQREARAPYLRRVAATGGRLEMSRSKAPALFVRTTTVRGATVSAKTRSPNGRLRMAAHRPCWA